MNSRPQLEEDFSTVAQQTEQKLLRLLAHASQDHAPEAKAERSKPPPPATPGARDGQARPRPKRPRTPSRRAASRGTVPEWSRPTAGFNTRLPAEMAELIDDLAYHLKKKRKASVTKQSLALEAFEDLLAKHGLLAPARSAAAASERG